MQRSLFLMPFKEQKYAERYFCFSKLVFLCALEIDIIYVIAIVNNI